MEKAGVVVVGNRNQTGESVGLREDGFISTVDRLGRGESPAAGMSTFPRTGGTPSASARLQSRGRTARLSYIRLDR